MSQPPAARPPLAPLAPPAPLAPLEVVQQWFQAVVTHPGGVAAGVASPSAQALVRLERGALEELVRGSSRLTAEERLSIYANAFYARLLECMAESFPVTRRVLGGEIFDGFAFDYLQRYPSRSYTLTRLAESFPRYLAETRPDAPAPGAASGFADLVVDLVTLELAIAKVFDGPGSEGEPLLDAADLPPAGAFAGARLVPVPCLRLLDFGHPVNAFYGAVRALRPLPAAAEDGGRLPAVAAEEENEEALPPLPAPAVEHVALSRTDFVVRRHALDDLERVLLGALVAGSTVGEAVAAAAAAASELTDEALARRLDAAFRRFTAAGFFRAVTS